MRKFHFFGTFTHPSGEWAEVYGEAVRAYEAWHGHLRGGKIVDRIDRQNGVTYAFSANGDVLRMRFDSDGFLHVELLEAEQAA